MREDVPERGGWLLPALLALLMFATAATCAVLIHDRIDDEDESGFALLAPVDDAGRAAAATARDAAIAYFSLDHRDPQAGIEKLRPLATREFLQGMRDQLPDVLERVERRRLVLVASVPDNATAVEYVDADRAQVLVATDVRTRAQGKRAGEKHYRIRVNLVADGETWRVSGLDEVPS